LTPNDLAVTADDLAGLSRRGCVRFAVACASRCAGHARATMAQEAFAAARAWLRCPCERHGDDVARAVRGYRGGGTDDRRAAIYAALSAIVTAYADHAARAAALAAEGAVWVRDDARTRVGADAARAAERQWQARTLAIVRLGDVS
jgi:hypothetical protein